MQYKGDTYIALNPTVKPKKKKKIKARKKGATTLAEARRSKHIGSEGEVAYGKPMK